MPTNRELESERKSLISTKSQLLKFNSMFAKSDSLRLKLLIDQVFLILN